MSWHLRTYEQREVRLRVSHEEGSAMANKELSEKIAQRLLTAFPFLSNQYANDKSALQGVASIIMPHLPAQPRGHGITCPMWMMTCECEQPAADPIQSCTGNETGYHTCGLPIGGCGKNRQPPQEDAK